MFPSHGNESSVTHLCLATSSLPCLLLPAWMDANDDGYIDADELKAVAAAVGSWWTTCRRGGQGGEGIHDFYVTLLEHAQASVECANDPAACLEPDEQTASATPMPLPVAKTLDFASFVRLMTSKAVTEYKTPEKELQPAFAALDMNDDGFITRDEMLKAMEAVGRHLPSDAGAEGEPSWAQRAATAFDALDRDKSGSLDYEEFVAVLSGMRSTTPTAAEEMLA